MWVRISLLWLQHSWVTCLCCILEETMPLESMAHKWICKYSARLKFLHQKSKYLTPNLGRLVCNTLIKSYFDHAYSAWYPNLSKKPKKKNETSQNRCTYLCLQLDKISHTSQKELEAVNWLPIKERYNQCVNLVVFKYFDNYCLIIWIKFL